MFEDIKYFSLNYHNMYLSFKLFLFEKKILQTCANNKKMVNAISSYKIIFIEAMVVIVVSKNSLYPNCTLKKIDCYLFVIKFSISKKTKINAISS